MLTNPCPGHSRPQPGIPAAGPYAAHRDDVASMGSAGEESPGLAKMAAGIGDLLHEALVTGQHTLEALRPPLAAACAAEKAGPENRPPLAVVLMRLGCLAQQLLNQAHETRRVVEG